jgi:hypothetical protein
MPGATLFDVDASDDMTVQGFKGSRVQGFKGSREKRKKR